MPSLKIIVGADGKPLEKTLDAVVAKSSRTAELVRNAFRGISYEDESTANLKLAAAAKRDARAKAAAMKWWNYAVIRGEADKQDASDKAAAKAASANKWWNAAVAKGAADKRKAEASELKSLRDSGSGITADQFMVSGVSARGKANMRVAATMFVSAARDTFASLASGQNPITVLLQQAPQVAQGFVMMGSAALKAVARFIPLVGTLVTAGLTYVSVTAKIKRFNEMLQEGERLDPFKDRLLSITEWMDVLDRGTLALQEFQDKYDSIGRDKNPIATALEEDIKKIKEESKLTQEVLQARLKLAQSHNDSAKAKKITTQIGDEEEKQSKAILARQERALQSARDQMKPGGVEYEAKKATNQATADEATVKSLKQQLADKEKHLQELKDSVPKVGKTGDKLFSPLYDQNLTNQRLVNFQIDELRQQLIAAEGKAAGSKRESDRRQGDALAVKEFEQKLAKEIERARANAQTTETYKATVNKITADIAGEKQTGLKARDVTEFQKLGAYAGSNSSLLDVNTQTARNTAQIVQLLSRPQVAPTTESRGVMFGGIGGAR